MKKFAIKNLIKDNIFRMIAAVYAVILFYFNFKRIFDEHIWIDEAFTAKIVTLSIPDLLQMTANDVHPPLYYLIVKAFCAIFGESVRDLHFVSIIAYAIMLIFCLKIVWDEFSPVAALVLMTFVSISDTAVRYNVEIRMYTWAPLFVLLSYYYFYKILKEDNNKNYILFVVLSLCAAYTQYYALVAVAFFYIVLFIYALLKRKQAIKKVLICYAVTIVCYLLWLGILIKSMTSRINNYWISDIPTFRDCFNYIFCNHFAEWMWAILIIVFITAFLYETGLVSFESRDDGKKILVVNQKPEHSILSLFVLTGIISLVGTMAFGIIISTALSPFFQTRYLYVLCPVAWLVVGILFSKLKLRNVWTVVFLSYMFTFFIPAYKEINEYDKYLNYETLLALNAVNSIPEEDTIIGNFGTGDFTLYTDYYFANRDIEYIDDDVTIAKMPKLDKKKNYWLMIYDERDLTNVKQQLDKQGYQLEDYLTEGKISYSDVFIYRIVKK